MSNEGGLPLPTRESDLQSMVVSLFKALRESVEPEKAKEIVKKAASKWADEHYREAKHRYESATNPQELGRIITAGHEKIFGKGVFPFEFKEGKVIGTAKPSYCRLGMYVKGEPFACEFCMALWKKMSTYIYPNVRKMSLKRSLVKGDSECVVVHYF